MNLGRLAYLREKKKRAPFPWRYGVTQRKHDLDSDLNWFPDVQKAEVEGEWRYPSGTFRIWALWETFP